MFKNKIKASLIHLGLSFLLVGIILGSIVFLFFPKLYIGVSDFEELASLIILVDLILGPILTFVVFQPEKKTLKFDLSVIAMIQLVALSYGAYALFQVHPVYITFNVDRFTLVSARDAEPNKSKYDEYKVAKYTTANLAFAKMPNEPNKRSDLLISAATGGADLDQYVEYYEPYKNNIDQILNKGLDPKLIFSKAESNKKIKSFIDKYNGDINDFVFIPLNSTKKEAIIVLDKISAQPVDTINTDPWELSLNK